MGVRPCRESRWRGRADTHELRHTCASLAIAAGANVKVLQTLLGHKTATLTLDRYGHLFPDDLGRIADAFDAAAEPTAYWVRTGCVLADRSKLCRPVQTCPDQ